MTSGRFRSLLDRMAREPLVRRYFIHRYHSVTWTLVFDDGAGHWHVEKLGPRNQRMRFSIAEFEKSDQGSQLGDRLSLALREAELDA
jgi:hypothetical protein